jgi:hypothetical protein
MIYLQRKDENGLETIDEFESHKEARAMLREYIASDPRAHHYLSSRACKSWREAK